MGAVASGQVSWLGKDLFSLSRPSVKAVLGILFKYPGKLIEKKMK